MPLKEHNFPIGFSNQNSNQTAHNFIIETGFCVLSDYSDLPHTIESAIATHKFNL